MEIFILFVDLKISPLFGLLSFQEVIIENAFFSSGHPNDESSLISTFCCFDESQNHQMSKNRTFSRREKVAARLWRVRARVEASDERENSWECEQVCQRTTTTSKTPGK